MLKPYRVKFRISVTHLLRGALRICVCGTLFFLVLICSVPFAWAEGELIFQLHVGEEYSDNFYRSETDEVTVYTTLIKPKITARAWTDWGSILAWYSPTFTYYSDDSDTVDASDDNYTGHEFGVEGALARLAELTDRLHMNVFYRARESREPGAYDVLAEGEATREKYRVHQTGGYLTYDYGERWTATLGYQYEFYNYEDSDNSYEHRWSLALLYHFDERNSLGAEQQYWFRRYPHECDYDASQSMLIYRRQLSDWLNFEAGGGYQNREFESGCDEDVNDFDGFVYRLALQGQSDISSVFLSYLRSWNDVSKGSEYFEAQRVTLELERTLRERWRCIAGGYYQNNDYETGTFFTPGTGERREDDIWNAHCGIRYWMTDWLSAGVRYDYTDRDSNEIGESYTENRIYGSIIFEYSTTPRR